MKCISTKNGLKAVYTQIGFIQIAKYHDRPMKTSYREGEAGKTKHFEKTMQLKKKIPHPGDVQYRLKIWTHQVAAKPRLCCVL